MSAKKKNLIISALVVVGLSVGCGVYIRSPLAQQQAIQSAEDWRMDHSGLCEAVLTPAVHPLTGARHVFSDGCPLPPGWVED